MSIAITKLTTFRGTLACLAVFAASAVTTVAPAASPNDEAPSVRVRYDDLNLSTVTGTNALYQRIVKAARQVCPDSYSSRDLDTRVASDHCQAAAIAKAVRDVNSPRLAAIHASHTSRG
jgi:UrcA family protein